MQVHELISEVGSDSGHCLGPARVLSSGFGPILVEMDGHHRTATTAVPGYQPGQGDTVLVIGRCEDELYIIGVLDTGGRGLRFAVDSGDVEFVATRGKARFVAEGGVQMTSVKPIELRSRMGVVVSVLGRAGQRLPRLSIGRDKTTVSNTTVQTEAEHIEQYSTTNRLESERLRVVASHSAEAEAETVRLGAGTLHSRVRNAYAQVEALWQLAAGRTRMVVKGTSHHKAQRLYSKAEKDVKIKADQIHLG